MASRFYGTQEYLNETEDWLARQYVMKNLGNTIHPIENGTLLIDEALMTPVNLDCFHCHQVHGHNCCEKGQPYSMEGENLRAFEEHAFTILKENNQDGRFFYAREKGIFEKTRKTNYYPSIRTFQGNCLFLMEQEGVHLCLIHRYALDKGLNPFRIKPFSCSLFPLEIIEMDNHLLITALTKKIEYFSRWGSYYRKNYSCINRSLLPPHSPKDYFPLENSKPAWFWGKDLLVSFWGKEKVEKIESTLPL